MPELLVLSSIQHTGTRFLKYMLTTHPQISPCVHREDFVLDSSNNFSNLPSWKGLGGGNLLWKNVSAAERKKAHQTTLTVDFNVIMKFRPGFEFILFFPGHLAPPPLAGRIRDFIIDKCTETKVIFPIRHPYDVLRGRKIEREKLITGFIQFCEIAQNNPKIKIIPVDLYGNLSSDERLEKMQHIFCDWLGLEMTERVKQRIIQWIPIGTRNIIKGGGQKERETDYQAIQKANLIHKLNEISIPYINNYH